MRILCISDNGDGLSIATHLSSEGHSVTFANNTTIGDGVVSKLPLTSDVLGQLGDLTVAVLAHSGKALDELRLSGRKVLGTTLWSETLEEDKEYRDNVIKSIGWTPGNLDNGINLHITTWFNGSTFIATYVSLIYKRFMAGGAGPDVDFTGMVGNFQQPTEKILSNFLNPLEKVLKRVNHRGPFHIHATIQGDTFSVKNISANFNNPLSLLLLENCKLSASEVLLRLFDETSKPIVPIDPWAAGVGISVPPYPYTNDTFIPVELNGILPANLKHLWLTDVKKSKNNWTSTGICGNLGCVTSRGVSVQECTRRIYRTIKNLNIANLQYRNDVGKKIDNLVMSLSQHGWIR